MRFKLGDLLSVLLLSTFLIGTCGDDSGANTPYRGSPKQTKFSEEIGHQINENFISGGRLVGSSIMTELYQVNNPSEFFEASSKIKYSESSNYEDQEPSIAMLRFSLQYLKTTLLSVFNRLNVSKGCRESLRDLVTCERPTSLLFLDATAKIPAGVMEGSIAFLGSFDQCLGIEVKDNGTSYDGQYCSILFSPKDRDAAARIMKQIGDGSVKPASTLANIRWDVCIPSSCSNADVEVALTAAANSSVLKQWEIVPKLGHCQTRHPKTLDSGQVTATVIFSMLGVVVLAGTVLDILRRLVDHFFKPVPGMLAMSERLASSKPMAVLSAFSLYTNWTKLFNTASGRDSLTAINGIRFLSMSWVILGHCYFFVNLNLIGNLRRTQLIANDFAFQVILNGTVSVDTFFFLSGLLVSYVVIREMKKNGRINWFLFYFHRIWRLSPGYAFVILVMLLFPLLGSGPFWIDSSNNWVKNCNRNWWINMLYINNVYRRDQLCMGHTWYLSNDMQFYVLSPVFLLLFHKFPKVGLAAIAVAVLGTVGATVAIGLENNYPGTVLFLAPDVDWLKFTQTVYIVPWCRAGPYLIGLVVGYFLALRRNVVISMPVQVTCWCLAVACNTSVLYGVLEWNKGNKSGPGINTLYLSTHRIAWSLGVAWVTYACATGHGGIVNKILSWKPFVPLGRLTYMAYLLHPVVQIGYTGTVRERIIYTHYVWVNLFLGFLCTSYGFSVLATLCFETPFLNLEKVLLGRGQPPARLTAPEGQGQVNDGYADQQKDGKEMTVLQEKA